MNKYGVDRKEDQADMDPYPNEEKTENTGIDDERECHWRNVLVENDGGVDGKKYIIHDKRWDLYVNKK